MQYNIYKMWLIYIYKNLFRFDNMIMCGTQVWYLSKYYLSNSHTHKHIVSLSSTWVWLSYERPNGALPLMQQMIILPNLCNVLLYHYNHVRLATWRHQNKQTITFEMILLLLQHYYYYLNHYNELIYGLIISNKIIFQI